MITEGPSHAVSKSRWALTQESFDSLLAWLDADRERAGRRYEEIRRRLIKILACRGCHDPEDLADEAINRVAGKVGEVAKGYSGDPALYFYGVANKVHLESTRRKPASLPPRSEPPSDEIEREHECLESCIRRLAPGSRALVIEYYQDEKGARIERRQAMAEQLGIALNALRIRAHRIRATLRECVQECVAHQAAA